MNVLIVEDDEDKRRRVSEFITSVAPNVSLEEARSFQSGLHAIVGGGHDLIILDMSMPTFDITAEEDGGRPQAYAGRELLRHMKRRKLSTPTIVLTQFDQFGEGVDLLTLEELDKELHASHPESYRGAIYYNVADDAWKDELEATLHSLK